MKTKSNNATTNGRKSSLVRAKAGHGTTSRQVVWARKARQNLIEALGGAVCNWCGKITEAPELDCIYPCGDKHHKMGFTWRTSFYRQQHTKGNIQVLCAHCNAQKSLDDVLMLQKES